MKRWLLFLALLLSPVPAFSGMILASEEWPPYSYMEGDQMAGFCTEVIRSVMGGMGVEVEITPYPWARAESMALSGQVDGLFSASMKDSRREACHYPDEPLFNSRYVFFIQKENAGKLLFRDFPDLAGKTVGLTQGYSYSEALLDFLKAHSRIEHAPTDAVNFRLLSLGRVDYFPAEIGNGAMLIRQLNLKGKVTYIDNSVIEKPYFIIFNKQRVSRDFVERFSQGLQTFKKTPEYEDIRERHLGFQK